MLFCTIFALVCTFICTCFSNMSIKIYHADIENSNVKKSDTSLCQALLTCVVQVHRWLEWRTINAMNSNILMTNKGKIYCDVISDKCSISYSVATELQHKVKLSWPSEVKATGQLLLSVLVEEKAFIVGKRPIDQACKEEDAHAHLAGRPLLGGHWSSQSETVIYVIVT